ncbi:MAG: hypothetical protein IKD09_01980, partial [Lentisphaeria bacterium]|nr:hypothetical protein [Lentisphaeria bacterium]
CASWHAVPLHTPLGVLHKNAFSDEAASFHFAMKHCSVTLQNMKHSAYAPYDLSSIALATEGIYGTEQKKYVPL